MDWTLNRSFGTPDGTIRWEVFGSGGSPVVLVHGTPYSSFLWRDVAPALSRDHRVYVFDLLGYGQSDKLSGQDLTIAAQAARLAALLGHWGLDRPALVANDIGGAITLNALLEHGATYRTLTLFDAVTGGEWERGLFDLIRTSPEVFAALPDYAHRALVISHLEQATHVGYRPEVQARYLQPWLGAEGQAAYCRQYRQLSVADTQVYEDKLNDIDIPVTLLWGRNDRILPPPYGEWIRDRLPSADFHWIEAAGHLLQEDAPAQLVSHLLQSTA